MHVPIATYRLQLHHQATFNQATTIVPYLKQLGISTLYLSPIFKANPYSQHGYDTTDYSQINENLGGYLAFKHFADWVHNHKLYLCVDIVPNHMAASIHNHFWQNVQTQGLQSAFAYLFDIDWEHSNNQLVYRRFFDVNELVCLRAHDKLVFKHSHQFLLSLINDKLIDGLRIDHIDGLREPKVYLKRLLKAIGQPFYIIVEKILATYETLPNSWPIAGTTGYDFLNKVNQLFIKPTGFDDMMLFYQAKIADRRSTNDHRKACIKQVIDTLFNREFRQLVNDLKQLLGNQTDDVNDVLLNICANMPVYRTYHHQWSTDTTADRHAIEFAISRVKIHSSQYPLLKQIKDILLLNIPIDAPKTIQEKWSNWLSDWQVLTGPFIAKGFEDTSGYRTNGLVSLNEVGSGTDCCIAYHSLTNFHTFNQLKQTHWPTSLNATSTHDTKRSEDMRARLNVLSELPDEWHRWLNRWLIANGNKKTRLNESLVPDTTDEFLIYQTLLGLWPLDNNLIAIQTRCHHFLTKAMRERKVYSNWTTPNKPYEEATHRFFDQLLVDSQFLSTLHIIEQKIAFYGMLNSLAQLVLKITTPGIPDFYQGCENWSFTVVDPDNRQVIDYCKIMPLIDESPLTDLLVSWQDGRIKVNTMRRLLQLRKYYSRLFLQGMYLPLVVKGSHKDHIIAFARSHHHEQIIIVTARWFSQLIQVNNLWQNNTITADNTVLLPETFAKAWYSPLTRQRLLATNHTLPIKDILARLPFNLFCITKACESDNNDCN